MSATYRRTATAAHVLVVDDDHDACRVVEKLLRAEGFTTEAAFDGESALAQARCRLPDVVLTDLQMPGMSGLALCQQLHTLDVDLPVIVMTGHSDMDAVAESLRVGADDYLIKPLQYETVLWCVKRAIARRTAKVEHETLYRTLNERLVLSGLREMELAEAEARQRAQLTALLENLGEGVAIGDPSGRVLMLNAAGRAILGLDDEDLSAVHSAAREARDLQGRPLRLEERPLMRATRGEPFVDYELLYARSASDRRRVVFAGTSVKGAKGNVELGIVVFRDVTELRRLEQERAEYLALVSHDLRNPLSVVLLTLDTLKGSMDVEGGERIPLAARTDLTERASRNAKRMNVMLDELSESTSLEAGGLALERVDCDVRELVANVVDTIDDARARRVTVEANGPCHVLADGSRLERVIANLLTNALKYSAEDAPVTIRLARKESVIELEVVDRGIGISPESVELLFERYFRTTAGRARASGLGLGLYITRLIVEAHGGRIEVSSDVGKGSTFRLILPSLDHPSRGTPARVVGFRSS